ncbi:helix-turn-helix transcriptional regulator [Cellulomonas cellasea]|uniref:XRE family transcriptional regulator n=1 Tax=Cellulomonas cellasea DSM 20118 TaxID=1408250 RepID=A0A0A0B4S7_9CELL|nr:helix-turn-helix transcriptional regulator [Cellulomonas cellasea]KGM01162.1 XRE family transcriptional regulator [Cellulomonas cellasea DSM 20118]
MRREAEGPQAEEQPAADPQAPGLRAAGPQAAGQRSPETVHNRIAVLRAERGISRRQLAEALDVHYQTVGYLERGEYSPSLFLALRIAEYFEVPVEVVFSTRPFPRIGS